MAVQGGSESQDFEKRVRRVSRVLSCVSCVCEVVNCQVKAERGQGISSVDFKLVFRVYGGRVNVR